MPTGYTAKLMEEGQNFEDFVMLCARAMGALVMMRDEPFDAPIPVFEPTDYYAKRLKEALALVEKLEAMGAGERIAYGANKQAKEIKRHQDWLAREKAENARLVEMDAQVRAWEPPTSNHKGLKEFMLEQIDTSLNATGYIEESLERHQALTPLKYYEEALDRARSDIEYHMKADAEERARVDGRNQWVAQLRASLKPETVSK